MAIGRTLLGTRCRVCFIHDEVESLRARHSTTTLTVGRLAQWPGRLINRADTWAVFPVFMALWGSLKEVVSL